MSAGTLVAPPSSSLPCGDGGTLDELVVALWAGLRADRSVACPVCAAEMTPEYGAHARAIGGSCSTCGSRLH